MFFYAEGKVWRAKCGTGGTLGSARGLRVYIISLLLGVFTVAGRRHPSGRAAVLARVRLGAWVNETRC